MFVKPSPIRALFVQSQTEIGGAETALLALTRNLNRVECQPVVALLGFGQGSLGERLRAQDVPVLDVPATRFRNILAAARTIQTLARVIREQRISAVVANGGHPLMFARPAALLAQVPCAWWVHHVLAADPLRDNLIGVADTLLGADYLMANSQQTARALRRHFPATPMEVIPPGIEVSQFEAAAGHREETRRALGYAAGDFVAGVFGRLQRNKGQHTVLAAAAELRRAGVAMQVLLVGNTQFGLDADYAGELKHYAQTHGLAGSVRFLGQRSDVAKLLAACDAAVQPAVVPESYGLTVAEAMAAGLPVIATGHGGPLEMIQDGVTGMFYAPGDVADLRKALQQLHSQPQLRLKLGSAAQAAAKQCFSVESTARKFVSVFRALGNGIPARAATKGKPPAREVQLEVDLPEQAELASRIQPN